MDNLRSSKTRPKGVWTEDELKAGLLLFFEQNGRYPTANEFDEYEYLPSARSVQRSFGGLVQMRRKLLPADAIVDHTAGEYRKQKAAEADKRAKKYEEEFYEYLVGCFLPIAVHEHKIIRPGNVACDFFIYLDGIDGIVVDLFYAQDIRTLGNIVNIKLKRYAALPYKVFFVLVGNDSIDDTMLEQKMDARSMALPGSIRVMTERRFKNLVKTEFAVKSDYRISGD